MNSGNVARCKTCGLEISIDLLQPELEARDWGGYFVRLNHREDVGDGCVMVRHRVESYVNRREAKHCRFYVGNSKLRAWGLIA